MVQWWRETVESCSTRWFSAAAPMVSSSSTESAIWPASLPCVTVMRQRPTAIEPSSSTSTGLASVGLVWPSVG